MELSSKTQYALLALLELTSQYQQQEPMQIRQIAAHQNIPDRYLEQLLATLRRGRLVRSQRGSKGGYLLAREPGEITLLDIVTCLEGPDTSSLKNDSPTETAEQAVVKEVWQEVRKNARDVLQQHTLQDLAERRTSRKELNLMYYI